MNRDESRSGVPRISEGEWVVMRVVWEKAPLTTNQVVEVLDRQTPWKPKTIHTLLGRLVKKGALAVEKVGREYCYWPRVTAEACERVLARSFLDSFFGGQLAPFLARFVEKERLRPEQVEQLKRILDGEKP